MLARAGDLVAVGAQLSMSMDSFRELTLRVGGRADGSTRAATPCQHPTYLSLSWSGEPGDGSRLVSCGPAGPDLPAPGSRDPAQVRGRLRLGQPLEAAGLASVRCHGNLIWEVIHRRSIRLRAFDR